MMNETYRAPIIFVLVVIVAILAYGALTMRDERSPTEKIGDAVHDLPQGADQAGRDLESRTPGQKLGDAVKDTGDAIKNNTNP